MPIINRFADMHQEMIAWRHRAGLSGQAEAVVIQLGQTILIRNHQSFGFVARIPQGKRILLVLRTHIRRIVGSCIALFTHE